MQGKKQTSEKVNEVDLSLFRVAKIIADTAILELAKGRAINEMKKVGMLVASEKLLTASTKGSANAAAMRVPSSSSNTALIVVLLGFSTPSTTSSLASPKRSCSRFVFCRYMNMKSYTCSVNT